LREKYRIPKGFQDIIPPHTSVWQFIEKRITRIFRQYGYLEMRVPVVEHTEVFVRSIGEATDIVEKEMYTFSDRAGRSLTLRPEGTAPVVRCYVQNGLHTRPSPQKYYYAGPMFRYERPQKGRFRQFHQIGAEAFGTDDPFIDAEMIGMARDCLEAIGLGNLEYEVNSIGCAECRPSYRNALTGFAGSRLDQYCDDCRRRYETNPMRVLDCKVPSCREVSAGAPAMKDYLCDGCRSHFESLLKYLSWMGVGYTVNDRLVRGLDYYTRTTFEITTTELGAQNAVAAGGRYDRLVEEFGGPAVPAVGFAMGMERLVELVKNRGVSGDERPDLFVICLGTEARRHGIRIVSHLRKNGFWCETNYSDSSLRSQMKRADRLGARFVFILGSDEVESGRVQYRRLSDGREGTVRMDDFRGMSGLLAGEGEET